MNERDPRKRYPAVMNPPEGSVVVIDARMIAHAVAMSRQSPRGRIIQPLHKSPDDALQRMLNALQPKSYIQPHRHSSPPKAESIIVLKGAICFLTFSDQGRIQRSFRITAGLETFGIDVMAGVYHTYFALEGDTILYEVKPGPYTPSSDKDFAAWAPVEGTTDAEAYLERLYELT